MWYYLWPHVNYHLVRWFPRNNRTKVSVVLMILTVALLVPQVYVLCNKYSTRYCGQYLFALLITSVILTLFTIEDSEDQRNFKCLPRKESFPHPKMWHQVILFYVAWTWVCGGLLLYQMFQIKLSSPFTKKTPRKLQKKCPDLLVKYKSDLDYYSRMLQKSCHTQQEKPLCDSFDIESNREITKQGITNKIEELDNFESKDDDVVSDVVPLINSSIQDHVSDVPLIDSSTRDQDDDVVSDVVPLINSSTQDHVSDVVPSIDSSTRDQDDDVVSDVVPLINSSTQDHVSDVVPLIDSSTRDHVICQTDDIASHKTELVNPQVDTSQKVEKKHVCDSKDLEWKVLDNYIIEKRNAFKPETDGSDTHSDIVDDQDPDWVGSSDVDSESDGTDESDEEIIKQVLKNETGELDNIENKDDDAMSDVVPLLTDSSTSNHVICQTDDIALDNNADSFDHTEKPFVRDQMDEAAFSFDKTYTQIYLKTYRRSENTDKSKHGRTYDRRHACFYCFKLFTNISTHLERVHKREKELKEILQLKETINEAEGDMKKSLSEEKHILQTLLRHKGDNLHNKKVMTMKEGEILLGRRNNKDFNIKEYGPCPDCEEWLILNNLAKHHQVCPVASRQQNKKLLMIQSQIIKGNIVCGSQKLKKEVFPSMIRDDKTEVAQSDRLISTLGDIWLMKNIDNKLRRKHLSSFRMRLCAKLLILLREETRTIGNMSDFIVPKYFETVVQCALKACEEDEKDDLKNPSTAIKLGYDLNRLTSVKLGYAIKENKERSKDEAREFQKLLHMEWGIRVSKLARVTLMERNFNKKTSLPDPKDIQRLASYLVEKLEKFNLTDINESNYREAVILAQSRLLLYNRRRPGELQSLTIDGYLARSTSVSATDSSLRQSLTELETMLLETQEIVEIRGKTGRGVPVILPKEVKKVLSMLSNLKMREKANIHNSNKYLFANTGETVVPAGFCLNEVKQRKEVGLKFPSRINANNLRKQTATIVQVMGLQENELQWVCNHLGHTKRIHEQFYRQTSGLIERIDIAKIMLMQENNLVSKYQNKKLSEIQLEGFSFLLVIFKAIPRELKMAFHLFGLITFVFGLTQIGLTSQAQDCKYSTEALYYISLALATLSGISIGFCIILLSFWLLNIFWKNCVLDIQNRNGVCYEPVKCCSCLWHV